MTEPEQLNFEIPPAETQPAEPVTAARYRRVIDIGDGASPEVFEGDSLEELVDKFADAHGHGTRKIRQQEAELRELRPRTEETPKAKELSPDDEYVITQELQKTPSKAFRRMFKETVGCEPEEFASVKQAFDAFKNGQRTNEAIATFVAGHPDYEDKGESGVKNGKLMKDTLAELGLSAVTPENLHRAYSHLKDSGSLALKDGNGEAKEPERIAPPVVEPTQRVTKKTSGISSHSRPTAVPVNTEPPESDAYTMPMDKLRELSNKQLSGRG